MDSGQPKRKTKKTGRRDFLEGRLERITYQHAETYFTVARFRPGRSTHSITVTGHLPGVKPGELLRIEGRWEIHPRFGSQFNIGSFRVIRPATVEQVEAYLSSGVVKGIGAVMARRLVAHFGADTLAVVENSPHRLREIPGIGDAKADAIHRAWVDHHAVRDLVGTFQEAGVSPAHAAHLLRLYGPDALDMLRQDPYQLVADLPQVGFAVADAIARDLGMPADSPQRIRAGFFHLLDRAVAEGHVFVDRDRLLQRCTEITRLERQTLDTALRDLAASREVVIEDLPPPPEFSAVYSYSLHSAEVEVAERLRARLSLSASHPGTVREDLIGDIHQQLAVRLSKEQLSALQAALCQPVSIISGGPGTGKTTLIQAISTLFTGIGKRVILAAPTGRAARRIAEVTGRQAATIHRILGYHADEGRFERNQDLPLQMEALIVDEASMIDLPLMAELLKAVPLTAHLVLVGDRNQLPPVGPGNVLADMIRSRQFPTVELTCVFRQAEKSLIVENAHRVLRGELPLFETPDDLQGSSEFYFYQQPDGEKAAAAVVDLCRRQLPEQFGFDPVTDIQVLTPMHRGAVGVIRLNQMLQDALNPGEDQGPDTINGRFRTGDKVMQLKNNYQKEVFNGEIGVVESAGGLEDPVTVIYDGRRVTYLAEENDELTLAYAISVHKSQGSEYPAVILLLMTQHYPLLHRNLLYTGMTRGRRLVLLIGSAKAIEIALQNDAPHRRCSRLAERLSAQTVSTAPPGGR